MLTAVDQEIKTCISCTRYVGCLDPKKSFSYHCGKFKPTQLDSISLYDPLTYRPMKAKEVIEMFNDDDAESEFTLAKSILDIVMSKDTAISRDLRVPDGDFPTAPNFYTFTMGSDFLKQKPYPWQVIAPTIYLCEYCPKCSDTEYIFETWKPTDTYRTIEKRIAFLEHGKCPHCGGRRSKFVERNKLNFYEEAALCLGQRSGKSANLGDVAAYLTHLGIKLQNVNEVYGLKQNSELHGTFVALTYGQAKDTLWDPYYSNLVESPWFCIAEDTSILKSDGTSVPIQEVRQGDMLKTLEGNEKVLNVFDNGVQECKRVELECGLSLSATDGHQVRCLSEDGLSLVWKRVDELAEDDYVVTLSQDVG